MQRACFAVCCRVLVLMLMLCCCCLRALRLFQGRVRDGRGHFFFLCDRRRRHIGARPQRPARAIQLQQQIHGSQLGRLRSITVLTAASASSFPLSLPLSSLSRACSAHAFLRHKLANKHFASSLQIITAIAREFAIDAGTWASKLAYQDR